MLCRLLYFAALLSLANCFSLFRGRSVKLQQFRHYSATPDPTDSSVIPLADISDVVETAEEKKIREKKEDIAERKAAEVFVTRTTGRYECQGCGYIYIEANGYDKKGIAPGTLWDDIDKFRCPQCGAGKKAFTPVTETLSGFQQNLKYGFGGNAMTGGQKQNLIFGGLAVAFAIFMSGYLLE